MDGKDETEESRKRNAADQSDEVDIKEVLISPWDLLHDELHEGPLFLFKSALSRDGGVGNSPDTLGWAKVPYDFPAGYCCSQGWLPGSGKQHGLVKAFSSRGIGVGICCTVSSR